MIDTLRVQWSGVRWGADVADWLRSEWPMVKQNIGYYDVSLPWEGANWTDDTLGSLGVKSNKRGNYLWAERSIPKFMYDNNCRVLSVEEAREGVGAWLSAIEQRFKSLWEVPNVRDTAKVQRLDLCHQTKVPCSSELFPYIARSLNATKVVRYQMTLCPVEVHLTGVTLHQNRLEHSRWYDKGVESGDERYIDVVRHEEQLRRGKAGYYVDISGSLPVFDVEGARARMNDRYMGWGLHEEWGTGQVCDLGRLVSENGLSGAAAVALVKAPELEPMFKRLLSNGTFYRVRNMALQARREQVPFDLRVPETSWAQPMVL